MHRLFIQAGTGLICLFVSLTGNASSLLDIYLQAKENDPQFRAAEASVKSAGEFIQQSNANFRPSVDVGAGINWNAETTPTAPADTSGRFNLGVTQSLYNYGNNVVSDQNENFLSQSETNLKAEEQNLMVRISDRYFDVLSAADNLTFARAEKDAIGRQLEQTKQRFDVGLVAITDVHEAQARYDSSVAETISAENAQDSALESLRELTGTYPEVLNGLKSNAPLIMPEPSDIEAWTSMALQQNLSIISSRFAVAQARDNIRLQRAGYHPTVNLTGSYSDDDDSKTPSNTSVSLNLAYNLYGGGRTGSKVRQAQHNLTEALENLEKIKRESQSQVRQAYLDVIAGISRVKALKQAVISSESAMSASEAGFEVGTRTTVDVLLARQALFSARRNFSQAKYDYITDTLRLKRAAGALSLRDIEGINDWLQ